MNIAIVVERFPVRSQTFVVQHVLGLASKGHSVTVLSNSIGPGISDDELERFSESKVSIQYVEKIKPSAFVPKTFWKMKRFIRSIGYTLMNPKSIFSLTSNSPWKKRQMVKAWTLQKKILKLQPDIVHFHFGNMAALVSKFGIPMQTYVTWHGYDANIFPLSRGEGVYRELLQSKLCIHTIGSEYMLKKILQLGAEKDRIRKIPMGVNLSELLDSPPLEIKDSPVRIISVGRLVGFKGHEYLIKAVGELIKSGANIELRIIGEGYLREELSQQINKSGYSSFIHLLGARTPAQVLNELKNSHIFALTGIDDIPKSGIETQGMVLIEAQSLGLPIVSSRVGGIPESLIHEKTGLLCEPKNIESIKNALQHFIEHPDIRSSFGVAGRKFVVEKFSLEKMLESFIEEYNLTLETNKHQTDT